MQWCTTFLALFHVSNPHTAHFAFNLWVLMLSTWSWNCVESEQNLFCLLDSEYYSCVTLSLIFPPPLTSCIFLFSTTLQLYSFASQISSYCPLDKVVILDRTYTSVWRECTGMYEIPLNPLQTSQYKFLPCNNPGTCHIPQQLQDICHGLQGNASTSNSGKIDVHF